MSETRRGFFGKVAAALVAAKVAPMIPREQFAPGSGEDFKQKLMALHLSGRVTLSSCGVPFEGAYVIVNTTGPCTMRQQDYSAPSDGTPRDRWRHGR